jgi:hypothetical protein
MAINATQTAVLLIRKYLLIRQSTRSRRLRSMCIGLHVAWGRIK